MSDFLEGVSRSIPTLFYDTLARICPGAAFVFFIGLKDRTSLSSASEQLIVLVVGGYITGVLLTVISAAIFYGQLDLLGRLSTRFKPLCPSQIWDQINAIDAHCERHAMLLVKIEAEMTLCHNLFVGFVILIGLQRAGYLLNRSLLFDLSTPIAWILGGTLFAAVVHRTGILSRRIHVLARLVPADAARENEEMETEQQS